MSLDNETLGPEEIGAADPPLSKTRPAVSVLIVNWNTRQHTSDCLDSIRTAIDDDTDYEVVVVDNASVDGSAEALERRDDILLIKNATNVGFASAVNQAYERSRAPLIFLLNSDVELMPGTLSILVRFLRAQPEAAGVAPIYLNPDGSPQPFHFRLPTFLMTLSTSGLVRRIVPRTEQVRRKYYMLDDDFTVPRPVEQPSASCLLLRRSVLNPHVIFDDRFPIFFNDVQFALKLREAGHTLWVTPDARVVHEGHASTRMLGASAGGRQYWGAQVRMIKDTQPPARSTAFKALIFVEGFLLLALRRPGALSLPDLLGAVRGDPGPLPPAPKK